MAATRRAEVTWTGSLLEGSGVVSATSSGAFASLPVTWASRTEQADGRTSPEELVAAAHASCYAMAFSAGLGRNGTPPTKLEATAEVDFQPGQGITAIRLHVKGDVPGLDAAGFKAAAETAKDGCPVSKALAAVPITLTVA